MDTYQVSDPPKSYVLLTVDVEDWFQVENLRTQFPVAVWPSCELRVERNTHRLLDLFDDPCGGSDIAADKPTRGLRATFFVLGWIAKRLPGLVREIHERGHEVASHGFNHQLCGGQSREELSRDIGDSKKLLEVIIGAEVYGFRAPSFSITGQVLEILTECGYRYVSSFNCSALNSRYRTLDLLDETRKGIAFQLSTHLHEIPVSNLQWGKITVPIGGGGYFRLIPFFLFHKAVQWVMRRQGAYVFYVHPWEIDSGQPRVAGARFDQKVRHYCNLDGTLGKLGAFLLSCRESRFVTCMQYLQE